MKNEINKINQKWNKNKHNKNELYNKIKKKTK